MKFSKEQKEGIARFLDTIAASAFIGAVVGTTGHSVLTVFEIIVLLLVCLTLLGLSLLLRKPP